jgi:hypothetical protein
MSGAWLHAGDALATTMWSLVPKIRILPARVLLVFRDATFAGCRSGGAFMPVRLALFRHRKSFRVGMR